MPDIDPKQAANVWQLVFEGAWPTSVAFLGDSRHLAAGNRNGQILLWELPEERPDKAEEEKKDRNELERIVPAPVRLLEGHTNGITHLAATRDGKTLISASYDHTVRIWNPTLPAEGKTEVVLDADRREQLRKRKKDVDSVPGVQVDVQKKCEILPGHGDWVCALGLSRDEKRLITGDDDCLTIVWDLPARKEITRWTGYPINQVTAAALSPDGKLAFTAEACAARGSFDRPPQQARIWNADDGKQLTDLLVVQYPNEKDRGNSYGWGQKTSKFMGRGFVCADFSADGKLLAVGMGGEYGKSRVHVVEVETGKVVRTVSEHENGVCDVRFTSDGKYLLTSGRDTLVRVVKVDDGKELGTLGKSRGGQFKDWIHAITLSPDEKWLAAADIGGLVQVWALS